MPDLSLFSVVANTFDLSRESLSRLKQDMEQNQKNLQEVLLTQSEIDTHYLAQQCAATFHLPMIEQIEPDSRQIMEAFHLESLCQEWVAIPVSIHDDWLTLAITDPTQQGIYQDFQFATGLNLTLIVADIRHVMQLLNQFKPQPLTDNPHSSLFEEMEGDLNTTLIEDNTDDYQTHVHSTPIGQFVQQVMMMAIKQKASDIHFEPYERHYRIRMRIDGVLVTTHTPSRKLQRRLASRIKIMAQLNIAERRLPQDGRMKFSIDQKRTIDIRVSTLPTLWGEKLVIRLLGSLDGIPKLSQLGFTQTQHTQLQQRLENPQGLILITGPTGSGKTTTLYSALQHLNNERRNLSTVEDPVEIQLNGVNQIQVHEQIGLGFSDVLRALLRQDPDVIMLGEIRDSETAQMAIRAAQTGHLVLSTLHTNSAPDALWRLQQMGIPLFQIIASLKLVIAQRLVRKLCPHCKHPINKSEYDIPLTQQHDLNPSSWFEAHPQGCSHCFSGYLGRTAIYDFFLDDERSLTSPKEEQLRSATNARGCQLWRHALGLIEQGITSFSEVSRVASLPPSWQSNSENPQA